MASRRDDRSTARRPSLLDASASSNSKPHADAELVKALLERSPQAERTFVTQFTPPLLAFFRKHGLQEADAEDALQVTFMRAFRSVHLFRFSARLSVWLHGIGHHVLVDHFRSARCRARGATVLALAAPAVVDQSTPDPYLARRLQAVLCQLRPAERVALLMSTSGYTHVEIGEALSVAVGTSKALVHRARKRARPHLTCLRWGTL